MNKKEEIKEMNKEIKIKTKKDQFARLLDGLHTLLQIKKFYYINNFGERWLHDKIISNKRYLFDFFF